MAPAYTRVLSDAEAALLAEIRVHGNALGTAIEAALALPGVDARAVNIGRTELQTGLMWLTRSITRPDGF